jgi:hypothetical protein
MRERTRTRQQGTVVTNPADFTDPGLARIDAIRRVVAECQYAKIDGIMVDLFTAYTIFRVYDALNEANQAKFRALPVGKMAGIAFKLIG